MNICVVGLGRLGAPFAALAAAQGHRVIGVDTNILTVYAVNCKQPAVEETGLREMMKATQDRFIATMDLEKAVEQSDVTFIIVPTPSEENGSFSLRYVLPVAEEIGGVLAHKASEHLVVLVSTVMPGQSGAVSDAINKAAGKPVPFCYNPAFVALGSVLNDLEKPDFILIGSSDREAEIALMNFYREGGPLIYSTRLINAELIKLAVNTYLTMKISFANMLGRICQGLPGADVDAVTEGVGLDSRIGSKYLKAGMGYGGPCLPRDTRAMAALAGNESFLPLAIARENQRQVSQAVRGLVPKGARRIAIFGISYKPHTAVTDGSGGLELSSMLSHEGLSPFWYDPLVREQGVENDPPDLAQDKPDAVVITTPHEVWKAVDYGDIPVIDPWRLLKDNPPRNWLPLGIGSEPL